MHISKEFLLEAVGLSLLVALILIGMQMFQRAMKITTLLEKGQEQQIQEIEEYEIVKYDGLLIDGMTAISYIKKMTGTYELPVHVITAQGEFTIADDSEYVELRDIDSEKYISPQMKYRCEIIRNENDVITELKIEIEKKGN